MGKRGASRSASGEFLADLEVRLCLTPEDASRQKASQRLRNGQRPTEEVVNELLHAFAARVARPEVLGLPEAAIDPVLPEFLLRLLHMVLPLMDRSNAPVDIVTLAGDICFGSHPPPRLELALRIAAWHRLRSEAVPANLPSGHDGQRDGYLRERFARAGADSDMVREKVSAAARSVDGWLAGGPLATEMAVAAIARALRSLETSTKEPSVIQGELRVHYAIARLVRDVAGQRGDQRVLDECRAVLDWAGWIDQTLGSLGKLPGREPSDMERSLSAEWATSDAPLPKRAFALGTTTLGHWRLRALQAHALAANKAELAESVHAQLRLQDQPSMDFTTLGAARRDLERHTFRAPTSSVRGSAVDLLTLFSGVPTALAEQEHAHARLVAGTATVADRLTLAERALLQGGAREGRAAFVALPSDALETPSGRLLHARVLFAEEHSAEAIEILDELCSGHDAPFMAHLFRVFCLIAVGQRQRAKEAASLASQRGVPSARYLVELASHLTKEQLQEAARRGQKTEA